MSGLCHRHHGQKLVHAKSGPKRPSRRFASVSGQNWHIFYGSLLWAFSGVLVFTVILNKWYFDNWFISWGAYMHFQKLWVAFYDLSGDVDDGRDTWRYISQGMDGWKWSVDDASVDYGVFLWSSHCSSDVQGLGREGVILDRNEVESLVFSSTTLWSWGIIRLQQNSVRNFFSDTL